MVAVVHDLTTPCQAPRCRRRATKEVNLASFVAYMAKWVCEQHVAWAEEDLRQYLPDR